MLAHTDAVIARIQTIPALAAKTFRLVAPRDAQGKVTAAAPYVVVQPADGTDTQTRYTGGRTLLRPRFTLHIVGSSYDNAQTVTELVKALFVQNGFGIQVNVVGQSGRNLRWSSPQPTQVDDDVTPPLIYNTVELEWDSEPTPEPAPNPLTKVSVSGHPGVVAPLPLAFQTTVRYPFFPPDTISRYRIWIGNRNYLTDTPCTASIWHDVFVGPSSGVMTGAFTVPPTSVASGLVSVAGAAVHSDWIEPAVPLTPGTEYLVSLGSIVTDAGTAPLSGNPSWISSSLTDAGATGATGVGYNNSTGFYEVWIEFEASTDDRQVLTVIGHSLNSAGNTDPAGDPWYMDSQSWAGQWAGMSGGIQSTLAVAGSSAADWADSSPKWDYFGTPTTAVSIWSLSTTIAAGATLETAKSELNRIIARARVIFGSAVSVLVFTEPGRIDLTAPTDAVRVAYNTWVKTNPFGAFAIIDADLILSDPANPDRLNPALDADGSHPNLAGHTLVAEAVNAVLPGSV